MTTNNNYQHPDREFFEELNVPLPVADSHGTPEDIRKNLTQLKAHSWHMEGAGQLVAMTDHGRLVQNIGTGYICKGMDDRGLPILQKITT